MKRGLVVLQHTKSNKAISLGRYASLRAGELRRYAHRTCMTVLAFFGFLSFATSAFAEPITCTEEGNNGVSIRMATPHPREALIQRPSGEIVWLQMPDGLAHKQIDNFENLSNWIIDSESLGTVYVDGIPEIQAIFDATGRYHLYIAENTETEPDNTYFIECYFTITE